MSKVTLDELGVPIYYNGEKPFTELTEKEIQTLLLAQTQAVYYKISELVGLISGQTKPKAHFTQADPERFRYQ